MSDSDSIIIIKITEKNNCPLYEADDEFRLSGRVLSLPPDKPACMTLIEDIKEVHALCESMKEYHENNVRQIFNCNGPSTECTGAIGLVYKKKKIVKSVKKQDDTDIMTISQLLSNFSIFQTLDQENIKELISSLHLKLKKFPKDEYIIRKGDPGINLFIILSGKVEVLGGDEISIAMLGKGEVFGEMSLLSGESVGAGIRVVEPVWILIINGKDFRKVLMKFPSLQMYFARLLARRLAQTNVARSEDFASAMSGKLSEIPPAELFQTLNQNEKTGILNLELSKGQASVSFREGQLIGVQYSEHKGIEAFFKILKEKDGRFKFKQGLTPEEMNMPELGDFMWLLMEGLNRIDEGN